MKSHPYTISLHVLRISRLPLVPGKTQCRQWQTNSEQLYCSQPINLSENKAKVKLSVFQRYGGFFEDWEGWGKSWGEQQQACFQNQRREETGTGRWLFATIF